MHQVIKTEKEAAPKKQRTVIQKLCVDIIAGTIAGINVTLVGHPFDTLKVRLQTQPHDKPIYDGLVDCFKKTLKWEGIGGLYKGVSSPLIGQMFFRANLFLAYFQAKRTLTANNTKKLTTFNMYIAGGIAWGWGAICECPIDFLKTQLQIQIIKSKTVKDFKPEYTGFGDLASKVWKINGIRSFYQGFPIHLMRNIPAGALHLGSFEQYRVYSAKRLNCEVKELPIIYSLIGGGIGGILYWVPIYPVDAIKGVMQADSPYKDKKKFNGILQAANYMYSEGGIKRFYKGFTPCLLRAIPANSVLLLSSSWLSEHL